MREEGLAWGDTDGLYGVQRSKSKESIKLPRWVLRCGPVKYLLLSEFLSDGVPRVGHKSLDDLVVYRHGRRSDTRPTEVTPAPCARPQYSSVRNTESVTFL